jgi:hypothetical protein
MKTEFDDILKKKWDSAKFPVDPEHREEMARLLDSRNRRRGGLIWWLRGLLLLIAFGGVLAYIKLSPDATSAVSGSTEGSTQPNLASPSVKAIESSPSGGNELSDTVNVMDHFNKSNKNENRPASFNNDPATTIKPYLSKESRVSNSNKINNSHQKSPAKPDMASLKNNDDQITTQGIIPGLQNGVVLVNQEDHKADVIEESDNEGAVISLARSTQITSPLDDIDISLLDIERDKPAQVALVFRKTHPLYFFGEASAGYLPAAGEMKAGWNIRAGAGIGYKLFPKTGIFLSAGYLMQKDGFDFERTSTLQQPDFGARSSFHTLTPDKLHFVYSRFGVQHRIQRHLVSLSGGTQWLYGAQGTIVIQEQNQFAVTPVETTKYTWLKLEGMQRLVWSGELHYGYQVTPRINLQLGLKYYFTHLKKEDEDLEKQGYYWKGKFAPLNPSFTINYRLYGKS